MQSPESVLRLVGGAISAMVLVIGLYYIFGFGFHSLINSHLCYAVHWFVVGLGVSGTAAALILAEIKPHPVVKDMFPLFNEIAGRAVVYLLLACFFTGRDADKFETCDKIKTEITDKDEKDKLKFDSDGIFIVWVLPFFLLAQGCASIFVAYQVRSIGNPSLNQPMNEMYPAPGSNLTGFNMEGRSIDSRPQV